jgi:hypothetical protein
MKSPVLLCLALALFYAPALFASDFSADSRVAGGGRTAVSRFYYAGNQWRIEEHLPGNEYRVTIFREDRKSLYVLWPDKKRYLVQALPDKELQILSTRRPGEELERTEQGQEKVSGLAATKYRVAYSVQGRTIKSIEWYSKDLGVVIKAQAEDSSWSTELTNIALRKQERTLFEVPADFEQLSAKDVFTGPQRHQEP